ncbi:DNA repair protein RadC [Serratia fonticola]|jgi:DNA repair protein RadC|uniref:RadC family protein n=1 Tax=Serratia fonticola TaxID=47917 RepID=UPI001376515B|nr:DNA repair protein RadC [Serratia fonticola]MBC3379030.1 DNA repair protein RadC [Serratia fonticola]NCG53453.1 DNA repair protein RadC [Serratia fonticola]NYA38230.1 DNA repair protein RadC [Serratia fonticola]QXN63875.1 DNA repair protein RadC [Serratia fonticola]
MNPSTLLASTALPLPAQRTVKRALSLLEKYLREPGAAFTSTGAARDWLRLQLAGLEREVFVVVYLDNQHRLLACETLFTGSIRSTEVHPREVVKVALRHNAAAVILAHNHPSGMAEPSQADRIITDRVKTALALVDVHVLDHLIIGGLDVVSFAERGWLPG